jgi:ESCRT-II complex subunit VPS25
MWANEFMEKIFHFCCFFNFYLWPKPRAESKRNPPTCQATRPNLATMCPLMCGASRLFLRESDPQQLLTRIFTVSAFYSLQPVDETRAKQLDQWRSIVLDYCEANSTSQLNLNATAIFRNDDIDRELSLDGRISVIDHLIVSGNAEWDSQAAKTTCQVFSKSAQEWAASVHQYAQEYAMFGSVYTVYELHSGDVAAGAPFRGVQAALLLSALRLLERQGRATLIQGGTADEHGVKFIEK